MRWASLFTAPFGLTEPLFVPEYWSPPSLFDLAHSIGFDIESLIFSFAIGGIVAVLYNLLTGQELRPASAAERLSWRHRLHRWTLAVPFLTFPALYFFSWNPIYPAIVAMSLGAISVMLCRPDLTRKTWVGSLLSGLLHPVSAGPRMDRTRLHRTCLESQCPVRPDPRRPPDRRTAVCCRVWSLLGGRIRPLHMAKAGPNIAMNKLRGWQLQMDTVIASRGRLVGFQGAIIPF